MMSPACLTDEQNDLLLMQRGVDAGTQNLARSKCAHESSKVDIVAIKERLHLSWRVKRANRLYHSWFLSPKTHGELRALPFNRAAPARASTRDRASPGLAATFR